MNQQHKPGKLVVRFALPASLHYCTSPVDLDGVEVGVVASLTSQSGRRRIHSTSYHFTPNAAGQALGLQKVASEIYLDVALARAMPPPSDVLVARIPLPFDRLIVSSPVDLGGVEVGLVRAFNRRISGYGHRAQYLTSYEFEPNAEGTRRGLVEVKGGQHLEPTLKAAKGESNG